MDKTLKVIRDIKDLPKPASDGVIQLEPNTDYEFYIDPWKKRMVLPGELKICVQEQ